jgi:hypothetical protein
MDVTVDGIYGSIETDFGPTGEVSVVFEPFNQRECAEKALEEMENNLDTSFEESEDAIVVRTVRHGATKGLGADITVFLPPEFDGALVLQNQGDGLLGSGIDVVNAGNAQSVDVSNEKDGSCYLTGNGVPSTRARCAGHHLLSRRLRSHPRSVDRAPRQRGRDLPQCCRREGWGQRHHGRRECLTRLS